MITQVEEERLLVISDLHLGNPFSRTKRQIVEFLSYACDSGYNLCINGDGIDIMQTSFLRIAREMPEVFQRLRNMTRRGQRAYYVIGNHDIMLEHLLDDWGAFYLTLTPFLNVVSGDKRIRIEHGHLYDPFFAHMPEFYEFVTRLAGYALRFYPDLYRAWMQYEGLRGRLFDRHQGIPGEPSSFLEAAREITNRGFDAVILGHTHHPGTVDLGRGNVYLNTGSWLLTHHYAKIDHGRVELKRWEG
jgi:UDP-2,3-diacylglucosamine pyrophosphatase LpxH